MGIIEVKLSTHPKTFVEEGSFGEIRGLTETNTPEQAAAMFARGDEYLRVWQEMLRRGEPIGPVITTLNTTPAEAIKEHTIYWQPPKP